MKRLALVIAIAGCAHVDPVVASGQSLDLVGQDFQAVQAFINVQYQAGKVTDQQYATWETFGRKFQALYPTAMDLYVAADTYQDQQKAQGAVAIIMQLGADLLVNTAFLPDAQRLIHGGAK